MRLTAPITTVVADSHTLNESIACLNWFEKLAPNLFKARIEFSVCLNEVAILLCSTFVIATSKSRSEEI